MARTTRPTSRVLAMVGALALACSGTGGPRRGPCEARYYHYYYGVARSGIPYGRYKFRYGLGWWW